MTAQMSTQADQTGPSRTQIDETLRAILRDVLGLSAERTEQLTPDSGLFGHLPELDSQAVADLLTEMEDRFDIIIEDDEIDGDHLETYGGLLALAETALRDPLRGEDERTGGKISVEIFPNASLGDERTLLEGMQIGSIDMGIITNGPVFNFLEEMAVFELPFLFPSREAAYSVLDGEIGQELLDRLSEVNLKGLAYAERGFRNLTNSQCAVSSPADMEGMRIRVMENPVYIDTFRALGANAVPMAWTEALTAMQQDTIDGQENPVNVVDSFKLDETQDYMTMTRHTYAPALYVSIFINNDRSHFKLSLYI